MRWFWQPLPMQSDDDETPYAVLLPSGALADPHQLEQEAAAAVAREKSLAARAQARAADARAALEQAEQDRAAQDEVWRQQLPPHLRGML